MTCPFCGETVEGALGEVEHMRTRHPEVIEKRLIAAGFYLCPNEHSIPSYIERGCETCEAKVVYEPIARGLDLAAQLVLTLAERDEYRAKLEALEAEYQNLRAHRDRLRGQRDGLLARLTEQGG